MIHEQFKCKGKIPYWSFEKPKQIFDLEGQGQGHKFKNSPGPLDDQYTDQV